MLVYRTLIRPVFLSSSYFTLLPFGISITYNNMKMELSSQPTITHHWSPLWISRSQSFRVIWTITLVGDKIHTTFIIWGAPGPAKMRDISNTVLPWNKSLFDWKFTQKDRWITDLKVMPRMSCNWPPRQRWEDPLI